MADSDNSRAVSEREWLVKADYDASRDFDKAIMTLAAGALGLSIAFVHDLAPHPEAVPMLGTAWGLFAASLLAILISFLASQRALRREIIALDEGSVLPTPGGIAGTVTLCLNILGATFLVAGVISLVLFAIVNV